MSVSAELLCSFELLKPLDSSALKNHIKKGRNKRQSMLNSPVSLPFHTMSFSGMISDGIIACCRFCAKLLRDCYNINKFVISTVA